MAKSTFKLGTYSKYDQRLANVFPVHFSISIFGKKGFKYQIFSVGLWQKFPIKNHSKV